MCVREFNMYPTFLFIRIHLSLLVYAIKIAILSDLSSVVWQVRVRDRIGEWKISG